MSEQPKKKLSRRDAFKILGATLGATVLANLPSKWSKPEVVSGVLPAHAQSTSAPVPPTVSTDSIVDPSGINAPAEATFTGTVSSIGSSPLTDRGFVWATTPNPTLPSVNSVSVGAGGVGVFSASNVSIVANTYYGRAYATNAAGTSYGADIVFQTQLCLAEGTLIKMADGTTKKIEDIVFSDLILVWNFDEGKFDAAQPLWIKKAGVNQQYNLIEFSDGSSIKTIIDHRIFNKELGAFTYPMTEDTPVGTTTFNVNGEEVTVVRKSVVNEQVNNYNVITDRHMNLFANGILTSCRYNNLYPIQGMKFVKDGRELIPQEQYGVENRFYEGLRLAEQTEPIDATLAYVNRLKEHELEAEPELAL